MLEGRCRPSHCRNCKFSGTGSHDSVISGERKAGKESNFKEMGPKAG